MRRQYKVKQIKFTDSIYNIASNVCDYSNYFLRVDVSVI